MVTSKEISRMKQEIRMLKDRENREKTLQSLEQKRQKLQLAHQQRTMGSFERGLRTLPQQMKKDVNAIMKTAKSPATKKKAKRLIRILDKI